MKKAQKLNIGQILKDTKAEVDQEKFIQENDELIRIFRAGVRRRALDAAKARREHGDESECRIFY